MTSSHARRRVVAGVFGTVVLLLLAACGGPGSAPGDDPGTDEPAASAEAAAEPAEAPASEAPAEPSVESPAREEEPATAEPQDDEAPPAAIPALLDFTAPAVGGGTVDGADHAGKPVALWFWAPW